MPRFLGMGVRQQRLEADIPYSVPTGVFCPEGEPLDVARAALGLEARHQRQPRQFDPAIPAIGVYGKTGATKGTYDLIASLGVLAREGREFNFLAMIGRAQAETIASAIRDAGLEDRTYILPMLPNWRVASFVRACTAVCFLEREFPIAIHGPIIPREVLACGTCLVLSREIASKQRYRDTFVPGENVLIVEDPKDHGELAGTLRSVFADPSRARSIGAQGMGISRSIEDHAAYILGWEAVFMKHVGRVSSASGGVTRAATDRDIPVALALESTVPDLLAFLQRRCPWIVEEFLCASADGEPRDTAVRFCDFGAMRLAREKRGEESPKWLAVVRYARARLIAAYDPIDEDTPAFSASDRLRGQPVSRELAWELKPVRGAAVRIEEFDHDVSKLLFESSLSGQEPGGEGADLAALVPERVIVLFQRSVNLIPCELRIDESTRELVNACDGTRTTSELVAHMAGYFGTATTTEREELTDRLLPALDRLYRLSVIVFGEQKHGWGWTGGARSPGENSTVVASDGVAAGGPDRGR